MRLLSALAAPAASDSRIPRNSNVARAAAPPNFIVFLTRFGISLGSVPILQLPSSPFRRFSSFGFRVFRPFRYILQTISQYSKSVISKALSHPPFPAGLPMHLVAADCLQPRARRNECNASPSLVRANAAQFIHQFLLKVQNHVCSRVQTHRTLMSTSRHFVPIW